MDDLISRQTAIVIAHNLLIKDKDDYWQYNQAITDYAIKLTNLPSAEKRGQWHYGKCSCCGYDWGKDTPFASVPNYCPNCGSRMDKE